MTTEIRVDEWIAELEALMEVGAKSGEGFATVTELCVASGRSRGAVMRLLKQAAQRGLLARDRAPRPAMDGAMRPVPCYRVLKPKVAHADGNP